MSGQALLELKGVFKRFGAVTALSGVDFHVSPGEVMALVGDNGAGKSTMIKAIAGIHPIDEGQILWEGKPVQINGPKDSARLGIEVVYQDLALCDNLDVVANLFLGRERLLVAEEPMESEARRVLARIGLERVDLRSAVGTLSGGQRQAVALARAAIGTARLVVLDEPTAALGVGGTRRVLDLVRRLRDDGRGVILTSHSLPDVFAVSDRIAVLRLGRNAATFRTADVTPDEVVGAITGWRDDVHSGGHPRTPGPDPERVL